MGYVVIVGLELFCCEFVDIGKITALNVILSL
jgi:hypothetical protein